MAAKIVYSPEAMDHLTALSKTDQVAVLDEVDRLLADQPTQVSRKRKFLRPNSIAQWELRLGALRVFYDLTTVPRMERESRRDETIVNIKAVGKKVRNELWIGGKRIQL